MRWDDVQARTTVISLAKNATERQLAARSLTDTSVQLAAGRMI